MPTPGRTSHFVFSVRSFFVGAAMCHIETSLAGKSFPPRRLPLNECSALHLFYLTLEPVISHQAPEPEKGHWRATRGRHLLRALTASACVCVCARVQENACLCLRQLQEFGPFHPSQSRLPWSSLTFYTPPPRHLSPPSPIGGLRGRWLMQTDNMNKGLPPSCSPLSPPPSQRTHHPLFLPFTLPLPSHYANPKTTPPHPLLLLIDWKGGFAAASASSSSSSSVGFVVDSAAGRREQRRGRNSRRQARERGGESSWSRGRKMKMKRRWGEYLRQSRGKVSKTQKIKAINQQRVKEEEFQRENQEAAEWLLLLQKSLLLYLLTAEGKWTSHSWLERLLVSEPSCCLFIVCFSSRTAAVKLAVKFTTLMQKWMTAILRFAFEMSFVSASLSVVQRHVSRLCYQWRCPFTFVIWENLSHWNFTGK